jgi:hypothetical protein
MKRDIEIPVVDDIAVAVVPTSNQHGQREWGVYLLNNKKHNITNVLINVSGEGDVDGVPKQTATLRFHFAEVKANTAQKFEVILPEAFVLRNKYWVSFYADNKLYDKKFIAEAGTIEEDNFEFIPLLTAVGVVLQ